jgi:hypothetical protein
MCNQLNEDTVLTKFKNTAKRQQWRCCSSLFGAGGGVAKALPIIFRSLTEPQQRLRMPAAGGMS